MIQKSRQFFLTILILLSFGKAFSQQLITLPSTVNEPTVGKIIKIQATTDGKEVRWYSSDPGLQVFPTELLRDSKTAVVWAMKPGTYVLIAYTCINDIPTDPAVCKVIVGQGPGPGPGPGPEPSIAPPELIKAYQNDKVSGSTPQQKRQLAAMYRQAANLLVPNQTIADLSTLINSINAAIKQQVPDTALPTLRDQVALYFSSTLPKTNQPLTPELRTTIAGLYTKMSTFLDAIPD